MRPPLARWDPADPDPLVGPVDREVGERNGLRTLADLRRRAAERGWRCQVLVVGEGGTATVVPDATPEGPGLHLVDVDAPGLDPAAEVLFLGRDDDAVLAAVAGTPPRRLGASAVGLREVGAWLPAREAELLATATALVSWHASHRFCAVCGSPTASERGGWVRRCERDAREHYPRVDPAMIVLVHDGNGSCVLGRKPEWPPGRYSCLAGFVEPGESVEAAVVREVAEECGLRVRELRYEASQPWPFPSSLMLAFTAVAGPGGVRPDPDELEDVRWFTREQLLVGAAAGGPLLPPESSIAYALITQWSGT